MPVSFFQRDRASLELAVVLGRGWGGTGAAGGDWQEETGDTPDTPAMKLWIIAMDGCYSYIMLKPFIPKLQNHQVVKVMLKC